MSWERAGERRVVFPLAFNLVLTAILLSGGTGDSSAQDQPPRIVGIERLDDTAVLNVGNGDNWHMTWAADGRQFTGLCDGEGFAGIPGETGEYRNSRVYAIIGDAPKHHFEFLPGYQPQIAPKWIAPDGKSFWLVWTNFRGGYAFNCQKVIIQTEDGK